MARPLSSRLRASPLLARLARWLSPRPARRHGAHRPSLHDGLNLVGYARGGLGLGENLRRFAETLHAAGLPFALVDFDANLGDRGRDTRLERRIRRDNPYPTNVFFVNADQMPVAREHFGAGFFEGRRNVGFWFWELERFPQAWAGAFDLVDEVWTASDFVRGAIASHTSKPVHRVALPVELPAIRAFDRAEFGLPAGPFLFCFHFDFHSFAQRKNPQAAIDAFRRAFPPDDRRAALLLKTINGAAAPGPMAALREAAGDDPRILLIDGFLDHEAAVGLMSVCDAFVSLHRSEGFGLGMAEAMCLGKPVVATGYSGNLDFMTPVNSCLVRHRLVPVGDGEYPYGAGQHWAEPDVEHAAECMLRLVDDPTFARTVGRAGAESIRQTHDRHACLTSMARALE
jgi:glycosyltransferase involved in cell wall biosynthesis